MRDTHGNHIDVGSVNALTSPRIGLSRNQSEDFLYRLFLISAQSAFRRRNRYYCDSRQVFGDECDIYESTVRWLSRYLRDTHGNHIDVGSVNALTSPRIGLSRNQSEDFLYRLFLISAQSAFRRRNRYYCDSRQVFGDECDIYESTVRSSVESKA